VFPSIDTKVCSAQTRRFNQEASKLENVQILTISMDLPFALDRFCAAEGIDNVVTLSDYREREFGLIYGFLCDETRLLARGTVVIDKDGVVRYVEFVPELGSEPNYDQAIAEAKKLAS
jgi:thiol peroxidase